MDVAITDLRAHLSDWLAKVADGGEIVVTDRGVPVARILGVESAGTLVRLSREGVIGRHRSNARPTGADRERPRPRKPVSDHVSQQRR